MGLYMMSLQLKTTALFEWLQEMVVEGVCHQHLS